MRRTYFDVQLDEIRKEMAPHSPEKKRKHPVRHTALLGFVLAGVTAITCFMAVVMPRQISQQADTVYTPLLQTANVGDVVCLGTYEQDNDLADGTEQIEWIVLCKQDEQALLVSKYALDYAPFNTGSAISTWDYSTLLQWLNESFFTTAFTPAEQSLVCLSRIEADQNAFFHSDPGKITRSRVFLLSLAEAKNYLRTTDDRQCAPTAYAEAQGANPEGSSCGWWLRSPGYDESAASLVAADGSFSFIGQPAERSLAVRPAIWVECGADDAV